MLQAIGIEPELVVGVLIFSIPIVAIVGGITAGILKTMSESRIIENMQRERIAAIQAGIDPARLPAVPMPGSLGNPAAFAFNPYLAARHRAQGLLIGGLITVFGGAGLAFFLSVIETDESVWAVGVFAMAVGVALLLSSLIVWPRGRMKDMMSGPGTGPGAGSGAGPAGGPMR